MLEDDQIAILEHDIICGIDFKYSINGDLIDRLVRGVFKHSLADNTTMFITVFRDTFYVTTH